MRCVFAKPRSSAGRLSIAGGLCALALWIGSARAADRTSAGDLERARVVVKAMWESGAFETRSDDEILADAEAKGLFSGEKGAAIHEDVDRLIRELRLVRPDRSRRFRHGGGATLGSPESEPNDSISSATATACGASMCASIQVAGDRDYFAYTIASSGYVVHETSCDGDTTLTLFDWTGSQIGFDDDGGAGLCSLLGMNLPAGTYFVGVGEFGDDGTVNYALSIDCETSAQPEIEPNDSSAQANALGCGSKISAIIDPVGETDWFRVDVPSFASVTVQTLDCAGDTTLFLRDAGGSAIEFDDDDGAALCSLISRDLFAGTYYLEIHEFGDNGTVTYVVSAVCTPIPPDEVEPNDSPATANPIACGESKHGAIAWSGDVDFWTFSLATDSTVDVMTECDGDSILGLFDSGGSQIAFDDDSGPGLCSRLVSTLAAGTYALGIGEYSHGGTFEYSISIDCFETVACGQTVSGSIASFGEVDRYALSLAAGALVTFDVACDGDGELTVMDSTGARLGFSDDAVGLCPRLRLNLPAGAYSVLINERLNDDTMNYSLVVTCEPPLPLESEPNGEPGTADAIACGGAVSGTVSPVADLDFWTFSLATLSQVVVETDCTGDTTLTLFDSTLTQIGFDDDGGAGLCSRLTTMLDSGTYYVVVGDFLNDGTLAYILELDCEVVTTYDEVEPNDDPASANPIACGEGLTGSIDLATDVDYWSISITEPLRLVIVLDCDSTDPALRVLDSEGNEIVSYDDDDPGRCPSIDRAFAPGTYFIEISESGRDDTLAYTLRVHCRTLHSFPVAAAFSNTLSDSGVTITSVSGAVIVPIQGYIGQVPPEVRMAVRPTGSSRPLVARSSARDLRLTHLSLSITADLPLGMVFVDLASPVPLRIGSDGTATGRVPVWVSTLFHAHTIFTEAAVAVRTGSHGDAIECRLGFGVVFADPLFDPEYTFDARLSLDQDAILKARIDRLIKDLADDDIEVREAARIELQRIGRPALACLEQAARDSDPERAATAANIILAIIGIRVHSSEWIGPDELGVWNVVFKIRVNPALDTPVFDVHLIVGKPDQSQIDHDTDEITLDFEAPGVPGFPGDWSGYYDENRGEIVLKGDTALGEGQDYCFTVRTPSMMKRGLNPMGWYFTDQRGKAIGGTGGKCPGPVFPK